ncbi:MAG: hypothetical protein FWG66_00895 [Spirochaetes bacterium]|nr:hypothetical protein [Spirochaetota bacterium]
MREEKLKKNYSLGYAGSKNDGVCILFPYLEEGIAYVKKHKIKDVCIWPEDEKNYTADLDFLQGLDFIENFEWLVPLSKKSSIEGIYNLSRLRYLRWASGNDFNIDFSKLTTIEDMNICYHKQLLNFEKLINLKELFVQPVKTANLQFLSGLKSLEDLRLRGGGLASLEGLEHCAKLKKLFIQSCYKLIDVSAVLRKLKNIEWVVIQSCKKNDVNAKDFEGRIPHLIIC